MGEQEASRPGRGGGGGGGLDGGEVELDIGDGHSRPLVPVRRVDDEQVGVAAEIGQRRVWTGIAV